MSKAADLASKLMTGRVETVETLKDTPAARLGLKNQDGRARQPGDLDAGSIDAA